MGEFSALVLVLTEGWLRHPSPEACRRGNTGKLAKPLRSGICTRWAEAALLVLPGGEWKVKTSQPLLQSSSAWAWESCVHLFVGPKFLPSKDSCKPGEHLESLPVGQVGVWWAEARGPVLKAMDILAFVACYHKGLILFMLFWGMVCPLVPSLPVLSQGISLSMEKKELLVCFCHWKGFFGLKGVQAPGVRLTVVPGEGHLERFS